MRLLYRSASNSKNNIHQFIRPEKFRGDSGFGQIIGFGLDILFVTKVWVGSGSYKISRWSGRVGLNRVEPNRFVSDRIGSDSYPTQIPYTYG